MAKRLLDKIYIIHLLMLILIIAGFLFVRYQVHHVEPIVYRLNASQDMSKQDIGFEIPISKGWLEKFGLRANQYDAAVINNTKYPMVDWSVEFTLPADSEISDYWSFDYEILADNRIRITGKDFNNDILANDRATFGFILFSPLTTDIEEFTVQVKPVYPATHFAMFYITCILTMIWLISLISTI